MQAISSITTSSFPLSTVLFALAVVIALAAVLAITSAKPRKKRRAAEDATQTANKVTVELAVLSPDRRIAVTVQGKTNGKRTVTIQAADILVAMQRIADGAGVPVTATSWGTITPSQAGGRAGRAARHRASKQQTKFTPEKPQRRPDAAAQGAHGKRDTVPDSSLTAPPETRAATGKGKRRKRGEKDTSSNVPVTADAPFNPVPAAANVPAPEATAPAAPPPPASSPVPTVPTVPAAPAPVVPGAESAPVPVARPASPRTETETRSRKRPDRKQRDGRRGRRQVQAEPAKQIQRVFLPFPTGDEAPGGGDNYRPRFPQQDYESLFDQAPPSGIGLALQRQPIAPQPTVAPSAAPVQPISGAYAEPAATNAPAWSTPAEPDVYNQDTGAVSSPVIQSEPDLDDDIQWLDTTS